jgi:hypothetical protein
MVNPLDAGLDGDIVIQSWKDGYPASKKPDKNNGNVAIGQDQANYVSDENKNHEAIVG